MHPKTFGDLGEHFTRIPASVFASLHIGLFLSLVLGATGLWVLGLAKISAVLYAVMLCVLDFLATLWLNGWKPPALAQPASSSSVLKNPPFQAGQLVNQINIGLHANMQERYMSDRKITELLDGIAAQTQCLAFVLAAQVTKSPEKHNRLLTATVEACYLAQKSAEAAQKIRQVIGGDGLPIHGSDHVRRIVAAMSWQAKHVAAADQELE